MASTETFSDMIKLNSKKRKRTSRCDADGLPAAKRPRMMSWASKRLEQKSWEWRERRRKIALGIVLYWEAQMRDIRRMARKRASTEMYADYMGLVKSKYMKMLQGIPSQPSSPAVSSAGIQAVLKTTETTARVQGAVTKEVSTPTQKRRLIKRLSDNAEAEEAPQVKVTPTPRRNGWRRKGEKRS
ncbi:uncharacterized protein LOC123529757 isoform X1 [Mercenaria mercenaria]|uniref:uncharacterized protein LOC123529757 isoform X1 n=2 Tax=Mercenaria mercenaria TaxID=6596 RepID=UPI00234E6C7C|nr:uncharacterized protein LOC123529757 isoform X1 [Mercenaria mercenaria]